jgi:hypothetical protein
VQVAVFDTAFHQTMPQRAYEYALPKALANEHKLRRYGAHGTSYKFLTLKAAQVGRDPANLKYTMLCHCCTILASLYPGLSQGQAAGKSRCQTQYAMTPFMAAKGGSAATEAGNHMVSLCGGETEKG